MARRPSPRAVPHEIPRHSHAAAPVAVTLLFVGLLLGAYTILVPALLGVFLLLSGLSFLGTRVNPLSIGFYLTTKPSWPVIGLLVFGGLILIGAAWGYYSSGFAPIVP